MSKPGSDKMGKAIRAARDHRRLTRKEVAAALSLSEQYLYQVETGRRRPSLDMLWKLAVHLEIDPNSLDPRLARKGG